MRAFLVVVPLLGCAPPVPMGTFAPTFAATDCAGQGVLGDATSFRVRAWAGDAVEHEDRVRASDGLPRTVAVSPGDARRVTVEALGPDDRVIAVARTARVTVKDGDRLALALRLRPADAFSDVCGTPVQARVGHTAAVLDDGTVWLAGGEGLASTERFDPATETFTPAATIGVGQVTLPRARATATVLKNGQVVLWGGEHAGAASSVTLVYDPASDQYGAVPARVSPPSLARSRHFAFRLGDDAVVVGGAPAQAERLSSATFKPTVEGDVPAADAAIAVVADGVVVVAGGAADPTRVDLVAFASKTFTTGRLSVARRLAAAAKLGDGALVAGGEGAAGGSSEWVGRDGAVRAGPAIVPRAEACAVTLEDGRALLVGGRDASGPVGAAELVFVDRTAATVPLPGGPRLHATCTLLGDGTVLVVGGGGPPVRFTPR